MSARCNQVQVVNESKETLVEGGVLVDKNSRQALAVDLNGVSVDGRGRWRNKDGGPIKVLLITRSGRVRQCRLNCLVSPKCSHWWTCWLTRR